MTRRNSKIFRYGRESGEVLLDDDAQRVWRLETRKNASDRDMFIFSPQEQRERRRAQHIGYYMFAGGMRQHAYATEDTLQKRRKYTAIRIMLALVALWLLFRWIPLD